MSATIHSTDRERDERVMTRERRRGGLPNLLECPTCKAPNGRHRAGCYNCGSLLQPSQHVWPSPLVRLVVGDANSPGRVLYLRR